MSIRDVKDYIKGEWTTKLQEDLYEMRYMCFFGPTCYKWDILLDNEFRAHMNIEYINDDGSEKGCFAIVTTTLKNDINKQLRNLMINHHHQFVRRRSVSHPKDDHDKRKYHKKRKMI